MIDQLPAGTEKSRGTALAWLLDEDLGKAVAALERATQGSESGDAEVWADLAALYVERSEDRSEPYDLVLALEAAEKAGGGSLSARFNRALALERLGFTWEARKAWADYLKREPDRHWRREAGERLAALKKPPAGELWRTEKKRLEHSALLGDQAGVDRIVDRFRLRARRFGEEELLGRWAEAWKSGDLQTSERALRIAESIGSALALKASDDLLADAVAAIRGASDLVSLADAHLAYGRGLAAYEAYRIPPAREALQVAHEGFSPQRSPMALRAGFFLALCEFQEHQYGEVELLLDRIESEAGTAGYPNLRGRILWVRGLMDLIRSRYEAARRSFVAGLEYFKETGERDYRAVLHYLLFECHHLTGQTEKAWKELRSAFVAFDDLSEVRVRQLILGGTAVALGDRDPRLTLFVREPLVESARASGLPVAEVEALRWSATVRKEVGLKMEALSDLRQAKQALDRLEEGPVRSGLFASLLLAEAGIRMASELRASLACFRKAIAVLEQTDYRLELLGAYHGEGRVLRALGDPDGAEAALAKGLEELERQRLLVGPDQRLAFWDAAQPLFEEMVALQIDVRNRPDIAFAYAEKARSRDLLESWCSASITLAGRRQLLWPVGGG